MANPRQQRGSQPAAMPDLGSILQLFQMFSPSAGQQAQLQQRASETQAEGDWRAQERAFRGEQAQQDRATTAANQASENAMKSALMEMNRQQQEFQNSMLQTQVAERAAAQASENALKATDLEQRARETEAAQKDMETKIRIETAKVLQMTNPELATNVLADGIQAIPKYKAQQDAVKQQQRENSKRAAMTLISKGKVREGKDLALQSGWTADDVETWLKTPAPVIPSGVAPIPTLPAPGSPPSASTAPITTLPNTPEDRQRRQAEAPLAKLIAGLRTHFAGLGKSQDAAAAQRQALQAAVQAEFKQQFPNAVEIPPATYREIENRLKKQFSNQ